MELKDLVGLRILSGVDTGAETIVRDWSDYNEQVNVINFILDGITYTAIEDPSDGYRSYMGEIKVTNNRVMNVFPAQKVFGIMRSDGRYEQHNIIDFYSESGQLVLAIGTANTDDYYPYCVLEYYPQNMGINQPEKKQINLRDKVYFLQKFVNEEHDREEHEHQLTEALWMLQRCQDALIGLEDEDWDKLNLDFEFIL